ncbi:MAG: dTDP-glucose 4,6-dehydratase [Phycisphaeraceae bacterium]|nr:dTDP-glucose 4,6-dehydratase [Phycisphaeraceae bacterium]
MTTMLITGGAGFIGSNFVRYVLENRPDASIINLDALTYSGNLENLAGLDEDPRFASRYEFVKGDIADRDLLAPLLDRTDIVIHMAAESHVDRSILDSAPFVRTNVLGTQALLDAARHSHAGKGVARFVHVSTDEVYGSLPLDRPDLKFTEDTPIQPNSPYAASKAASDLLVRAAFHTFHMPVLTTRCSNNFGPYQFPEKVIPLFVTNLIEGRKVPLYGDGKNVRDWLHVLDHCEAILTVAEKGRVGEVYNIGGDNERSNLDLTRAILDIMGKGHDMIQPVEDRKGHDRRYAIDASKIERELGWRPTRSAWPDALEQTVRWYMANAEWWRHVKSGAYREFYKQQYSGRERVGA